MSDLRSLAYSLNATPASNYPREFLVYNTNVNSFGNGGQCCLWTAPAGTVFVTFEIWGGGGSGAGACCCQQGAPGGAGAYSIKTICAPNMCGWQYSICAGGTTSNSTTCCGIVGCTSYVTGCGLSNFCATGGPRGDTHCFYHFCYTCCIPYAYCCCAYGGDLNVHGTQSTYESYTSCGAWFQQHMMAAPMTVSGPMLGPGGCLNGGYGCGWWQCPSFPGGGGASAQTISGNCWCGMWGAGGLVSITYG